MATIREILLGGKNGLFASRSALDIVSRNINNAETEGYTRQTPLLSPLSPSQVGVLFEGAKRERFIFLERRMHFESQNLKDFEAQKGLLERIESLFSDNEGSGLLSELDEFLNSFEELSTNPEAPALRQNVVLKAQQFTFRLRETAENLAAIRIDSNRAISQYINEINSIVKDIALLNKKIAEFEAAKENPNELKDKRDLLIRKLSEIVDINTFETENGMINVYLKGGGHVLVDRDRSFSLQVEVDLSNQSKVVEDSDALYKINYVDGKGHIWNITPFITSGALGGTIKIRDKVLPDTILKLNALARQIVQLIGSIHAKGVGASHIKTATSTYSASDSFTPINSASLPYNANAGQVSFAIYDESGNLVTIFTINYDPDVDGIANIASLINGAIGNNGYLNAFITPDNRLKLEAQNGFRFDIFNDTGGLAVSLGIDTLIVGENVFKIDVESIFKEDPKIVSSSSDPASPFSNDIALQIAQLRTQKVDGVRTLSDIYIDIQNEIANSFNFVNIEFSARKLAVDTLEREIQQRSGVSLDEEFVRTIQFQRAFEASARVVRIADEMLLTILGLTGGG